MRALGKPVLRPGDEHILRQRLQSRQRRVLEMSQLPRAAVLIPIVDVEDELGLLFARRSETVGTHKGQVAFPGGHVEAQDPDLIATALRETQEEIGIMPSQVEVLGLGDDVVAISRVVVTPVVARIKGLLELSLDSGEVDYTFVLSLDHLANPESRRPSYRRETPIGIFGFPVFSGGPAPVWGLTAWMVDELLPLLGGSRPDETSPDSVSR